MFPTVTQGRVDQRLTNVLLAYTNPNYFADKFFPTVPGLKDDTGLIPTFGKEHLRTFVSKRSLYDESDHRINFEIGTDLRYAIDYFDLASYVPDRLREQMRTPFDAYNGAQLTLLEGLKLERDVAAAAALTSTAILTQNTTLSGVTQWTDKVGSDPVADIQTAVDTVQDAIGRAPNKMSIERHALTALRNHPAFLAIAKAQLAGGAALAVASNLGAINAIKAIWGFDEVFVPSAIKVTSKKGQTVTMGQVWAKDCVVYYAPNSPELFAPSFGYSFQLDNYNLRTVVRRSKSDKGDDVEVMWAYQDAILDASSAYLIKSAA